MTEPLTADAAGRRSAGTDGEGIGDAGEPVPLLPARPHDDRILWGGYDAVYYYGNGMDARHERNAETLRHAGRTTSSRPSPSSTDCASPTRGAGRSTRARGSPRSGARHTAAASPTSLGYTGLGVAATRFGARVMLDLLHGRDTERTRLQMVRTKPLPVPAGAVPAVGDRPHPLVASTGPIATRAGATCGCAPSTGSASASTPEASRRLTDCQGIPTSTSAAELSGGVGDTGSERDREADRTARRPSIRGAGHEHERITHWIDGKPLGRRGRAARARCYDPATGAGQRSRRLRLGRRRRRRRRRRQGRPSASGGTSSLAKRTQVLFAFRELLNAQQGGRRRRHHRRARQGALRRARRGDPGPRGRRVRVRHPAPAQGRILRGRLDQGRRLLDPAAARRRRRSSRRSTSRRWCRCGSSRWPSPRATPSSSSRARRTRPRSTSSPSCGPRPVCPPASSTSCTVTRWPSTALLDPPGRQEHLLRRLDPDRQVRLRDRHRARQARAGARRCEEPHGGAARRRPRPRRRRRGQRRIRLRRRALHGDLRPGRRRAGRRRARRKDRPSAMATLTTGDGRRGRDMGPLITRGTATR